MVRMFRFRKQFAEVTGYAGPRFSQELRWLRPGVQSGGSTGVHCSALYSDRLLFSVRRGPSQCGSSGPCMGSQGRIFNLTAPILSISLQHKYHEEQTEPSTSKSEPRSMWMKCLTRMPFSTGRKKSPRLWKKNECKCLLRTYNTVLCQARSLCLCINRHVCRTQNCLVWAVFWNLYVLHYSWIKLNHKKN